MAGSRAVFFVLIGAASEECFELAEMVFCRLQFFEGMTPLECGITFIPEIDRDFLIIGLAIIDVDFRGVPRPVA